MNTGAHRIGPLIPLGLVELLSAKQWRDLHENS
ncbi:MAG: hypothetical protein JWR60_2123 [Polaromonas sp.]|nr:hypothetical protein [Polaromonas sp.]